MSSGIQKKMKPFSNRWQINGGRIGVVFGETLWRYLSSLIPHTELASDRAWSSIRPIRIPS
jgi:hypothetical protein